MIVFFKVVLKDLFKLERMYPWQKPEICPCCGCSTVWGHGYVTAWFDGFTAPLFLKRYRCPTCGCVMRLRPREYFPRFQTPIHTIRSHLSHRLQTGAWFPDLSRNRQGHWLRALQRRVVAMFGMSFRQSLMEAFDCFILDGLIPVSRSL